MVDVLTHSDVARACSRLFNKKFVTNNDRKRKNLKRFMHGCIIRGKVCHSCVYHFECKKDIWCLCVHRCKRIKDNAILPLGKKDFFATACSMLVMGTVEPSLA